MPIISRMFKFLITPLLVMGMVLWAGCGNQNFTPKSPSNNTQHEKINSKDIKPAQNTPEKKEMITNGGFEQGIEGWVVGSGSFKTETNGNKSLSVGNNWQVYQVLNLEPNTTYKFSASTRKGVGNEEVRFKLISFDQHARRLGYYNIMYKHKGSDWENIPAQNIKIPANTKETILYVLSNGKDDIHYFDNISLTKEIRETKQVNGEKVTISLNLSSEKLKNNGFDHKYGWSNLEGKTRTSNTGNNYLVNGYNWEVYQNASVTPGKQYRFSARTRKGTAAGDARFVINFLDSSQKRLQTTQNIYYKHQGTDWESISEKIITAPEQATKAVIYVLSNDPGTGKHHFDDIFFTQQ